MAVNRAKEIAARHPLLYIGISYLVLTGGGDRYIGINWFFFFPSFFFFFFLYKNDFKQTGQRMRRSRQFYLSW